mgnify:CR=1 FL=1
MNNNLSQVSSKYTLAKDTLVLILAGGRGSRLHELTDKRAKPALYFAVSSILHCPTVSIPD